VLDKAPEDGGLKFRSGLVVNGHGRYPAVANCWYYVDIVTVSAISHRKQEVHGAASDNWPKTPLTAASWLREISSRNYSRLAQ
jgi:hypothetical protein